MCLLCTHIQRNILEILVVPAESEIDVVTMRPSGWATSLVSVTGPAYFGDDVASWIAYKYGKLKRSIHFFHFFITMSSTS